MSKQIATNYKLNQFGLRRLLKLDVKDVLCTWVKF